MARRPSRGSSLGSSRGEGRGNGRGTGRGADRANRFDSKDSTIRGRGGIHKKVRADGSGRVDRDGDMSMGGSSGGFRARGGRDRGGRGRGVGRNGGSSHVQDNSSNSPWDDVILQNARNPAIAPTLLGHDGLVQFLVRGWKQSKAAANEGGAVKDLIVFIEKKATKRNQDNHVRIEKREEHEDALLISVSVEDAPAILGINGYEFAGAQLSIEVYSANVPFGVSSQAVPLQDQITLVQLREGLQRRFTEFLDRRYDERLKLLDLSSLANDEDLKNLGLFTDIATDAQFFRLLMKTCDLNFPGGTEQKRDAITSVTLAKNKLNTVGHVMSLAHTLPDIKNLDISQNDLENLKALVPWRFQFRHLEILHLKDNPIVNNSSSMKELETWYPTLLFLNDSQIRSKEGIKASSRGPLPIQPSSFFDEGGIGQEFLTTFFFHWDQDRSALLKSFYDTDSSFSMSVNTSAPRDDSVQAPHWERYIKNSRNQKRVTTLGARVSRLFRGQQEIDEAWKALPASTHPDLYREPEKWCIECNSLPGIPPPSGGSDEDVGGVNGLIIVVHGEFGEVAERTGNVVQKKSFDRTFVLGPSAREVPVRVITDMLVVRAYGGSNAWKPDLEEVYVPQPTNQVAQGIEASAPAAAPDQESLVIKFCEQTGLTIDAGYQCLGQTNWDPEGAMKTFQQMKHALPPDAFALGTR